MESQTFRCERPDGTQHGAHTLLLDGEVALTGYYKNGEQHGHLRSTSATPPSHSDSLYDEGIGVGTWRATEGEVVTIKEHREGGEIHFTQRTADGRRIAEGVLVDGLRQGPWIFGEGEEQRTTSYDAGTAEGATGITGDVECDAGVQRWRECLAPKRGATRYQMADWLSFYVLIWERVPEAGDGRPMCVAYMPLLAQQLAAYGCAAS